MSKEQTQHFLGAILSNDSSRADDIFRDMVKQKYQEAIEAKKLSITSKFESKKR